MPIDAPDEALIALIIRVASRDEAAFKALYDQSAARLYGLALRIVRNREWAQDVLQESFLQVWRNAGDYRGHLSPPMAWMGLIVRSRGLDFLRRRTAERTNVTAPINEHTEQTLAGNAANPLDEAQASQLARALHQCLARLENQQREVVSQAYLRDLPTGEPRSLGVLGEQRIVRLEASEGDVASVPLLAISLEPKGGVPSAGGPTGPVLFKGALIRNGL